MENYSNGRVGKRLSLPLLLSLFWNLDFGISAEPISNTPCARNFPLNCSELTGFHSTPKKMSYHKLNNVEVLCTAILAAAPNAELAMRPNGGGHWSNTQTIRFELPGVMAG